jgi:hypothetical protein
MKSIYTFFTLILLSTTLFAQSFQFDPTDDYNGVSPLNQYKNHYVFMENLTGGSLDLAWTRISIDFPEDWEATLCDFGGCYIGIPESGQMLSIEDTTRGYLRITLNPFDQLDTGYVSFYVYDVKEPDNGDTVLFTLASEYLTNLDEDYAHSRIRVYPNPASEILNVDLEGIDATSVKLINLQGKSVLYRKINSQGQFQLEVADLRKGVYLLNLEALNGEIVRKKILIQ